MKVKYMFVVFCLVGTLIITSCSEQTQNTNSNVTPVIVENDSINLPSSSSADKNPDFGSLPYHRWIFPYPGKEDPLVKKVMSSAQKKKYSTKDMTHITSFFLPFPYGYRSPDEFSHGLPSLTYGNILQKVSGDIVNGNGNANNGNSVNVKLVQTKDQQVSKKSEVTKENLKLEAVQQIQPQTKSLEQVKQQEEQKSESLPQLETKPQTQTQTQTQTPPLALALTTKDYPKSSPTEIQKTWETVWERFTHSASRGNPSLENFIKNDNGLEKLYRTVLGFPSKDTTIPPSLAEQVDAWEHVSDWMGHGSEKVTTAKAMLKTIQNGKAITPVIHGGTKPLGFPGTGLKLGIQLRIRTLIQLIDSIFSFIASFFAPPWIFVFLAAYLFNESNRV